MERVLAVGVTAKLIARKRNVDKKIIEDYFIAGLLHDLGLLAEIKIFPEDGERILLSTESVGLLDAEDVILDGLNHCTIGKLLADRWRLSDTLSNVLLLHHTPFSVEAHAELVLTVYLSNIICKNNNIGLVLDKPPLEIDAGAYDALGVEASMDGEVPGVLETEIDKATEFLAA